MKVSALPPDQQLKTTDSVLISDEEGTKTASVAQLAAVVGSAAGMPSLGSSALVIMSNGDIRTKLPDADWTDWTKSSSSAIGLPILSLGDLSFAGKPITIFRNGRFSRIDPSQLPFDFSKATSVDRLIDGGYGSTPTVYPNYIDMRDFRLATIGGVSTMFKQTGTGSPNFGSMTLDFTGVTDFQAIESKFGTNFAGFIDANHEYTNGFTLGTLLLSGADLSYRTNLENLLGLWPSSRAGDKIALVDLRDCDLTGLNGLVTIPSAVTTLLVTGADLRNVSQFQGHIPFHVSGNITTTRLDSLTKGDNLFYCENDCSFSGMDLSKCTSANGIFRGNPTTLDISDVDLSGVSTDSSNQSSGILYESNTGYDSDVFGKLTKVDAHGIKLPHFGYGFFLGGRASSQSSSQSLYGKLKTLDLSDADFSSYTGSGLISANASGTWAYTCQDIEEILLRNAKFGSLKYFNQLLFGASNLSNAGGRIATKFRRLDCSGADFHSASYVRAPFSLPYESDSSRYTTYLSNYSDTDADWIFDGCDFRSAEYIQLRSYTIKRVPSFKGATFGKLTQLSALGGPWLRDIANISTIDTSKVTTISSLFYQHTSLTDISAMADCDFPALTSAGSLFSGCTGVKDFTPLNAWAERDWFKAIENKNSVFSSAFYNCTAKMPSWWTSSMGGTNQA